MRPGFVRNLLILASAVPLGIAATPAQTVTVDDGVFRILSGGQEVGKETFSIRRNGSGATAVTIAQGRVVLESGGGRDMNASLELSGPELHPTAYQITIQGTNPERIAGRIGGGRFSARIVSPTGEQMREYLASDGAVVVDDGLAHQYYFVAQRATSGSTRVPLLIPQQSKQVMATVAVSGPESVEAGGQRVSARRLDISAPGLAPRRVWVDAQGQVLRVEIPSTGYTAVRAALPPR